MDPKPQLPTYDDDFEDEEGLEVSTSLRERIREFNRPMDDDDDDDDSNGGDESEKVILLNDGDESDQKLPPGPTPPAPIERKIPYDPPPEFKAGDGLTNFDDSYMQSADAELESHGNDHKVLGIYNGRKSSKLLMSPRSDQSGEIKVNGSHSHHYELPALDRMVNGDHTSRPRKGESGSHTSRKPPLEERSKGKDRHRSESKPEDI